MMMEALILLLAAIGVFFMFVSAIGVLRLPDVYTRMHASGKAATMGVISVLVAAGLYFGAGQLPRMVVLIVLFFVTAPIASTSMARAVYRVSNLQEKFVLRYDDMANDQSQGEL